MFKHHYVYKSFEEEGREYIGIRSCDCLPEEDTEYFGSFYDKTFNPTRKIILFTGETRQEVAEIEVELHDFFDVAVNPQFANQAKATSAKFDRAGVPTTEETKKKISVANTGKTHTKEWKQAHSERMSGENNPNYGVPRTEAQKKAMSGENNPMYGRTGEKHPLFGVPRTEEWKKAMSGENHPLFGVPNSEAQKKAHSERMSGEKHPRCRAIIAIEPNGTQRHFWGATEAAKQLKTGKSNVCQYLKTGHVLKWGKFKGWQFIYENPEVPN